MAKVAVDEEAESVEERTSGQRRCDGGSTWESVRPKVESRKREDLGTTLGKEVSWYRLREWRKGVYYLLREWKFKNDFIVEEIL